MEEFKAMVNLRPYFENSYGYVVFESIKTTEANRFVTDGSWVVDGAYGKGAVYVNLSKTVDGIADNVQTGTSTMLQASKGQHVGLKTPYPMIIFLQTQPDYQKFAMVGNNFEFGGDEYVLVVPEPYTVRVPPRFGIQEGEVFETEVVPGTTSGLYAKGMAVFTPFQKVAGTYQKYQYHRFDAPIGSGKVLFVGSKFIKFPITGQHNSYSLV